MDCSSVSYSYSIVSTPLLPEEECSKDGKDSIFEEFYKGRCRQKMHILISLHFVIKQNRLDDMIYLYILFVANVRIFVLVPER